MTVEEVEEIRVRLIQMDENLMSFWGLERLNSDEVEVRDYFNNESEYPQHEEKIIYLLSEIKDIFITMTIREKNTIVFEFNGFGVDNHIYYPMFGDLSTVELLKVYIPRFERSMIHLFNFVKMGNITEREFMLEHLGNL